MLTIALLVSFVFLHGHDTYVEDASFDYNRVSALRDTYGANFFLFRSNGTEYIVTDPAVLKKIDTVFEPERDLARKQAELGDKQAALGDKQAQLGARQAELGVAQASARDATTQQRLSAQQEELSRRQETLSREQQSLSDMQAELSEKQKETSRETREKLGSMTKDWICGGTAKVLR